MSAKMQKNEKGPLSHQKTKCSFLDYIQLLMISQAIRVKMPTEMLKSKKGSPKSSKNQKFIFGLHSTSDDWLSDPCKKCQPKQQKNEKGPLSHQKINWNRLLLLTPCDIMNKLLL